ncbi:hypothetical protein [Helicobacter sp. 23-1045]
MSEKSQILPLPNARGYFFNSPPPLRRGIKGVGRFCESQNLAKFSQNLIKKRRISSKKANFSQNLAQSLRFFTYDSK